MLNITNMAKLMSNRQLEIKALKNIRSDLKDDFNSMAELCKKLVQSDKIPIEWRKKNSTGLEDFVIKNKRSTFEDLYKKL